MSKLDLDERAELQGGVADGQVEPEPMSKPEIRLSWIELTDCEGELTAVCLSECSY